MAGKENSWMFEGFPPYRILTLLLKDNVDWEYLEVEQSGDNWKLVYIYRLLRSTSTFEINFRLGEIFEINPRGKNMKVR